MSRKPLLPLEGVQYYIKSYDADLYVGPSTGSINPELDKGITFNTKEDIPANRYVFENINGYMYMRHYASGKYLYIGGLGNGSIPYTTDSLPQPVSAIRVVVSEGLTYIQNHKNPSYILHPQGGNAVRGTAYMYWTASFRPAYAIELIPVEPFAIVSMKFTKTFDDLTEEVLVASKTEVGNQTDDVDPVKIAVQMSESTTNTFSFSFSQELGVAITSSFSSNVGLASASTTFTVDFKLGFSQTSTTSNTFGIVNRFENEVPIPIGYRATLSSQTFKKSGSLPFEATLQSPSGFTMVKTGTMTVQHFFKQKFFVTMAPITA